MPSEALNEILGEDVVFDTEDEAGEVVGLLGSSTFHEPFEAPRSRDLEGV
jgi:hypothetical protein